MFLNAHHLAYTYPDAALPALDDVTASFADGWTGIVGSNGAGKSTLLKILCGILDPDGGAVSPPIRGAYCAQATDGPPGNLEDFALDWSAEAVGLRRLLRIDDEWPWRFDTLSHGERKRIQIACALVGDPAILALDEPTNHLDGPTRALVARALASYRGIGLLVSHDRALLDELAYQCVFMDGGSATSIPGTYTEAKAQMELRQASVAAERRQVRDELARLRGEGARRRAEADRAGARRSARHLDRHDRDGRAKIKLAIVSGQDGRAGKLSAQMEKKIERAEKRLGGLEVKKTYDKPLEIDAEPSPRKVLARLEAGALPLGDRRLLHHPALAIGNRDRIGIAGGNGKGKSTLVRALLDPLAQAARVAYVPQEIAVSEGRALLADIKGLPLAERGRLLSIVARLNSPPARVLAGDDLSPGELRKLMLARGLVLGAQAVIMDEPTNHLDLASIEALQEVLAACPCALVLVSHDEPFLTALTEIRWVLAEGEHREGEGVGDTALTIRL